MSADHPSQKLSNQVESLLHSRQLNSPASMDELAKSLDMSVRTLRRRLAAQRTTFSEIIEKWRIATAMNLLQGSDTRICVIAKRLGYTHPSNFERAFKRWTGVTPSDYRNSKCGDTGPK